MLDNISNGDPTKWDEITNWNVIKFLNVVSFLKDKADYIKELQNELKGYR